MEMKARFLLNTLDKEQRKVELLQDFIKINDFSNEFLEFVQDKKMIDSNAYNDLFEELELEVE